MATPGTSFALEWRTQLGTIDIPTIVSTGGILTSTTSAVYTQLATIDNSSVANTAVVVLEVQESSYRSALNACTCDTA